MTSKKLKAGLITAGCGVIVLMLFRSIEQKSGNKAKAWIYNLLITDGSFDKDETVSWLVRAKFAKNAREAERSIREVIDNITPKPKKPT